MANFPFHLNCSGRVPGHKIILCKYGKCARTIPSDATLLFPNCYGYCRTNIVTALWFEPRNQMSKLALFRKYVKKAKVKFPLGHKCMHARYSFASTKALYARTSSQFLCLLHTALAPTKQQEQQPPWLASEDYNFPPHFTCCLLALSLARWR